MTLFKNCLQLAVHAHKNQKRKDGRPYITHPIRVSRQFTDERLKCIAVMHDVIEDGNESFFVEIPEEIIDVVKILTKKEGMDYETYIYSILGSGNKEAIEVKIADIMDNLSDYPSDKQIEKYSWALELLL